MAFSRTLFGGVEGEQINSLHLGTQVRSGAVTESGLWLGGEAMYVRQWIGYDSPGIDSETANGWTLAAMAGVPLGSVLGAYVAAGVDKYGGSGPYGRVGFEWRP